MPANIYESLCSSLEHFFKKNTLMPERKKRCFQGWVTFFHYSGTFSFFYGCSLPACSYNGWGENSKFLTLWAEGCYLTSSYPLALGHRLPQGKVILQENCKLGKYYPNHPICQPKLYFFSVNWSHNIYSVFWMHKQSDAIIYPVLCNFDLLPFGIGLI